jgi:POT family proton-dependent oligopeptide transporter
MENSSEPHYRRDATLLEVETLPHVVEPLPLIVWVALMIGAAERFTFYAVATPWRTFYTPTEMYHGLILLSKRTIFKMIVTVLLFRVPLVLDNRQRRL